MLDQRITAILAAFLWLVVPTGSGTAQPISSHEANIARLEALSGLRLDEQGHAEEHNASTKLRKQLNETRRKILNDGPSTYVGGKPAFTVGYNKALEVKARFLTGTRVPLGDESKFAKRQEQSENLKQRDIRYNNMLRSRGLIAEPSGQLESAAPACSPSASAFNWRDVGKVSPVRQQGVCGSCWAFATAAALESSYLIRNNQTIKVSEQHLVSCSRSGSCDGGWAPNALEKMLGTGVADGTAYPYTGTSSVCELRKATPYHWSNWGLVAKSQNVRPSPAEMKQALCEHGPLITTVFADEKFQSYRDGVLNRVLSPALGVNHAVSIVGWDDSKNAWLIKNSWGQTDWGRLGGFGWVDYQSFNIGYSTAWVQAHKEVELKDKCRTFDADRSRVRKAVLHQDAPPSWVFGPNETPSWVVADGQNPIRSFGDVAPAGARDDPNENDARLALTLMRNYKINQDCNTAISKTDAPFQYWLVGGKPPVAAYRNEDCVAIDWQRLDVSQLGTDWVLSDGTSQLEVFDGQRFNRSEDAAWLAFAYLKKHRMTQMCYFSRRDTSLRYYRQ